MMKSRSIDTSHEMSNPEMPKKAGERQPRREGDAHSYLTRLTRHRLLSLNEEIELATRARSGDKRAKDRLVEANMRLVVSIAKSYQCPLIPFEDLVQEGAIGLMTAADRYDSGKGFRFSTFATHWIRQSISRAVDNKSKAIRIPAHVTEMLRKVERQRAQMLRDTGEEPTAEILAQSIGTTTRKMTAMLQAVQDPISLDMVVGEEENTSLAGLIDDCAALDPQQSVLTSEMRAELKSLLAILNPREREVMDRRLGYSDETTRVLQDIGEAMHLSRERVRQIELIALKKLRYAAKRRDLYSYLSG